ncbi:MAG: ribonuclease R [Legionellaceae bacterium]|nr:ribonuclease R [Legionellaceae bacterium]
MSKKNKDPFFKREKEKYDTPIPSREYIMQILADYGRPMSRQQLYQTLELSEAQQEVLGFRLKAMLRDTQIMQDRRNRFCLMGKINLRRGTVQGHPDGFGFFIPDDGEKDMVLSAKTMRTVMNGDVVLAWQTGVDRRGRPEAQIHEVLEHANKTVVGRYFTEHGVGMVIPDNKRLTQDISVPMEMAGEAKNGQMVLVEIVSFPTKRNQAIGKLIHILGEHMAPGMEIEVAIHAHALPADWPDAALNEVARIAQQVEAEEISKRKDLRHLPFVTIDGDDAKDLDDAVYCYPKPKGGFQLLVAIADVSHYVRPGSALDAEAMRRGNSVYFPGQVVPMLPEALSNGICSLNPHADRLCLVAELAISAEGKIANSRFYRAVFHSHARLTYHQVAQWLAQDATEQATGDVWTTVASLNALYQVLNKARKARGAIDFDTTETKIEFDEHRKIKQIIPQPRNDAHRIIEECMLAANVATARYLQRAKIPAMYRVHQAPDEDKMTALRQFLSEWGLTLGGGKKPHPKDFLHTMNQIGERSERHIIEMGMLRSLKQAMYEEENNGHFGLAYPAYTHFTSPIRRYPDLLIHRALGHLIDRDEAEGFAYTREDMAKMARHCSMTERRADEATREVVSWLKCEYMQDKLGQVFEGTVSAVTSFGIFVELNAIYVEGLVHVTSLKSDYYAFDAVKHRLVGERSGKIYQLGDSMKVLVARVDLDERKIDFEPCSDEDEDG